MKDMCKLCCIMLFLFDSAHVAAIFVTRLSSQEEPTSVTLSSRWKKKKKKKNSREFFTRIVSMGNRCAGFGSTYPFTNVTTTHPWLLHSAARWLWAKSRKWLLPKVVLIAGGCSSSAGSLGGGCAGQGQSYRAACNSIKRSLLVPPYFEFWFPTICYALL